MNVFDLCAKLTLDDSDYNKKINQSEKGAVNFASKLGGSLVKGVGTVAKYGAMAVGAVSTAVSGLAKIGMDYNTEMETYTTNFETMLGSQEKAVAKVDELKKFASSTPLSMADLSQGTQTLLAFGVASDDSTEILRQLGDIALGDADKMQRLATAFGKATAQGKVTGDTVQQMTEAGWNPLLAISEKTGESMADLQKRMSAGNVSMEELKNAMVDATSGSGQFAGGMEKASHTTVGLMSTLQDNAKALVGDVFQPLSDSLLGDVLPMAIDSIALLSDSFKTDGVDGMMEAVGTILENIVSKITEYIPTLLSTSITIIQALANAVAVNLPTIIEAITGLLPQFIEASITILGALATGLMDSLPTLLSSAVEIIMMLSQYLIDNLPLIIESGFQIISQLALAIADALPELIPQIVEIVLTIAEGLIDNVDLLIDGAIALIIGLAEGLIDSMPKLIEKIPDLVIKIVEALIRNAPKLWSASIQLVIALADGLVQNWTTIIRKIPELITKIKEKFLGLKDNFKTVGVDFVASLWNGIKERWNKLVDDAKNLGKTLKESLSSLFGGSDSSSSSSSASYASGYFVDQTDTFGGYAVQSSSSASGGQIINVVLQGDADRIFRLVQQESSKNVRLTGQPSF